MLILNPFSWDSDTVGTGWHIKRLTRYCLYFGYYRCRNMSMRHVLETLRLGDDDQMYTFYSHTFQKV